MCFHVHFAHGLHGFLMPLCFFLLGIVLSGESKGPQVTTVSCTLELTDETDGFFKPAFPYRGKVQILYSRV